MTRESWRSITGVKCRFDKKTPAHHRGRSTWSQGAQAPPRRLSAWHPGIWARVPACGNLTFNRTKPTVPLDRELLWSFSLTQTKTKSRESRKNKSLEPECNYRYWQWHWRGTAGQRQLNVDDVLVVRLNICTLAAAAMARLLMPVAPYSNSTFIATPQCCGLVGINIEASSS